MKYIEIHQTSGGDDYEEGGRLAVVRLVNDQRGLRRSISLTRE